MFLDERNSQAQANFKPQVDCFFGFLVVLVWFSKGWKSGRILHSMLIFLTFSPKDCVFSLLCSLQKWFSLLYSLYVLCVVYKKLHATQNTLSCLQTQTSTVILFLETRIKITENHFSSDFISGGFSLIISFIPLWRLSLHTWATCLYDPGNERLRVTLGYSWK